MNATLVVDASYCQTTKVGAYAFWFASSEQKFPGKGVFKNPLPDNVCAEMQGIVNALYIAFRCTGMRKGDKLVILTDCEPAIQAFTGLRKLFKEPEVKAKRVFDEMAEHSGVDIEFRHVKAHTTRTEARFLANAACDRIARQEMKYARHRHLCNSLRTIIDEAASRV